MPLKTPPALGADPSFHPVNPTTQTHGPEPQILQNQQDPPPQSPRCQASPSLRSSISLAGGSFLKSSREMRSPARETAIHTVQRAKMVLPGLKSISIFLLSGTTLELTFKSRRALICNVQFVVGRFVDLLISFPKESNDYGVEQEEYGCRPDEKSEVSPTVRE